MLKVIDNSTAKEEASALDDLAREGARRMLSAVLDEEVAAYIERYAAERDMAGRRLVVRNGRAQRRQVACGAGTLEVRAPRVNDRRAGEDGLRQRFTTRIRKR